MKKMKDRRYLVFIEDEYFNNIYMGVYGKLEDALPDINENLEIYGVKIDELNEYASTFGYCFDKEVEINDGGFIWIRGFILDKEDLEVKCNE